MSYPADFGPWVDAADVDAQLALISAASGAVTGQAAGTPIAYKFASPQSWSMEYFDAGSQSIKTTDSASTSGAGAYYRQAYEAALRAIAPQLVQKLPSALTSWSWPKIIGGVIASAATLAIITWFVRHGKRR